MYIFLQVLIQYFFHDYYPNSILSYDKIEKIQTPWYYKIFNYQLYKIKSNNTQNPLSYCGYILVLCNKNTPMPKSKSSFKATWINNYFSCLPLYIL